MNEKRWVTGVEAVELIWPFGEVFAERIDDIKKEEVNFAFDDDAEAALNRCLEAGNSAVLDECPIEVWRILYDRYSKVVSAWTLMGDAGIMRVPLEADAGMLLGFLLFQLTNAAGDLPRSPH